MKGLVKALVVLAALALAGWYAYVRLTEGERPEEQRQQASYTAVRRGPLVIDLIESGSIKPRKQYVIKSQVEGRDSIT